MSKVLKVVLVMTAILLVTCAGGAYVLWKRYGKAMVEMGAVAWTAGEEYGPGTDNSGCVREAELRFPSDSGVFNAMQQGVFLQACLPKSTPSPGFCEGIPAPRDRSASSLWLRERCPASAAGDPRCTVIVGQIQAFCHPSSSPV